MKTLRVIKSISGLLAILCTAIFGLPEIAYIGSAFLLLSALLPGPVSDLSQASAYAYALLHGLLWGNAGTGWLTFCAGGFLLCALSHGLAMKASYKKIRTIPEKAKINPVISMLSGIAAGPAVFICVAEMTYVSVTRACLPCMSAVLIIHAAESSFRLTSARRNNARGYRTYCMLSLAAVLMLWLTDSGEAIRRMPLAPVTEASRFIVKTVLALLCAACIYAAFFLTGNHRRTQDAAKDTNTGTYIILLTAGTLSLTACMLPVISTAFTALMDVLFRNPSPQTVPIAELLFRHGLFAGICIPAAAIVEDACGIAAKKKNGKNPKKKKKKSLLHGPVQVFVLTGSLFLSLYTASGQTAFASSGMAYEAVAAVAVCFLLYVSAVLATESACALPSGHGIEMIRVMFPSAGAGIYGTAFVATLGLTGTGRFPALMACAAGTACALTLSAVEDGSMRYVLHGIVAISGIILTAVSKPAMFSGALYGNTGTAADVTAVLIPAGMSVAICVTDYIRGKREKKSHALRKKYAAMAVPEVVMSMARQARPEKLTPESVLEAAEKIRDTFVSGIGKPCDGNLLYAAAVQEEESGVFDSALILYTCAALDGNDNALCTLLQMGVDDSNYFLGLIRG